MRRFRIDLSSASAALRTVSGLALTATSLAGAQQPNPAVHLDRGLVLTWASSLTGEPDYESRVEVLDSNATGVRLRNAWNRGSKQGSVRWRVADRDLSHEIRRTTRSFYASLVDSTHDLYLGSTFLMAPVGVLADLKATGYTDVVFFLPEFSRVPYTGTITRVGTEAFPVVFNDRRTSVRGVRATGILENPEAAIGAVNLTFVFLDDPKTPWMLEIELLRPGFRGNKRLARVSYRPNVEAELAARCRATVYDIHFAIGSAEIDPASSATIAAIAKAMTTHRDWKLEIAGHTDSIGSTAANLDLSRRRAEATRQALVTTHGVDAARLRAEGRGEEQPIEENGTLAGRARNRRVELLRECQRGPAASATADRRQLSR